MPDRPEIPDALRDAVERTMQATLETRGRAQEAVDDLVKGAGKGIKSSRRSVRAAVEERLPATQEDLRALRTELRRVTHRLEAIEARLSAKPKAQQTRKR